MKVVENAIFSEFLQFDIDENIPIQADFAYTCEIKSISVAEK